MEGRFRKETISEVINLGKEIQELLCSEGFENIERVVRKTKILAGINNDLLTKCWLSLELTGAEDAQALKDLNYDKDIKQKATLLWHKIHETKDVQERLDLYANWFDKILERRQQLREIAGSLILSEYELEDKSWLPLDVLSLVELAENIPISPDEIANKKVFLSYKSQLIQHEDSKLVLKRLKTEINEYIEGVICEAREKEKEVNTELEYLRNEVERLNRRSLKGLLSRLRVIIEKHIIITTIFLGIIEIIGFVLTALMFFGVYY